MKNCIIQRFLFPLIIIFFSLPVWGGESVSNTSWKIISADGHIDVQRFNADGTCVYFQEKSPSGNEGEIFDNCTWKQNGEILMFEYNNYFQVRIAIVDGSRMKGRYVSRKTTDIVNFEGLKK